MKRKSTLLRGGVSIASAILTLAAVLQGCTPSAVDGTLFQDVTPASGLGAYRGMTHGAAWGDFDGDGRPDLWVTNHLQPPQLWRNLGGGRFEDVTARWFDAAELQGDKHGAVWADFDNDGRPDLVQLTGAVSGMGAEPKRLFRHHGDRFADEAAPLGVDNLEGRTRMPLWLDLDADGRLDLFQGAEARLDHKATPFTFMQGPGRFDHQHAHLPLGSAGAPFCVLTELTGDGKPELVCRLMGQAGAVQVFDLAKLPAHPLDLLPQTAFEDIAAADFDNDGRMDLLMARRNASGTVALGRPSARELVASVLLDKSSAAQPAGFSFRAQGPLQVTVANGSQGEAITPQRIHLGAAAAHPKALTFELRPEAGAITPPPAGAEAGVYIGFTAPDRWDVRITAPRATLALGKPRQQDVQLRIAAAEAIDKVEPVGELRDEAAPFRLFMNRGSGKLAEESEQRGLNKRLVAGMNVVAADFDNDMDVDLFVLASGEVGQQENLLLLNDGQGRFKPVRGAGGAGGRPSGVGDAVAVADFDGDGFPDLLIANGGSMGRSLGLPSDGGGYQLYRNLAAGNGNHWLQVELEGTRSSRDAIGAIVRVSAGGTTQMRVQDGGVHHRVQNHARIHFGMARNLRAQVVTVHWPSGTVQELRDVKADQVLRIKEPGAAP